MIRIYPKYFDIKIVDALFVETCPWDFFRNLGLLFPSLEKYVYSKSFKFEEKCRAKKNKGDFEWLVDVYHILSTLIWTDIELRYLRMLPTKSVEWDVLLLFWIGITVVVLRESIPSCNMNIYKILSTYFSSYCWFFASRLFFGPLFLQHQQSACI